MELKSKLATALVKFQGQVPVIPKNKTAKIPMKSGGSYSYNYADLADIWEAVRTPLMDNGLAVTQLLKSTETTDYIVTKIWHESGETDSEDFAIPTSGKTPQEVGSVVTYYKRYALGAALGISTEEDDDAQSSNKAPVKKEAVEPKVDLLPKAKKAINEKLEELNYNNAVNKKAKVHSILSKSTIDTLDDADKVMDVLEADEKELLENQLAVEAEKYGTPEK